MKSLPWQIKAITHHGVLEYWSVDPPCPPWCDSESKMLMQSKPGLGQGRDLDAIRSTRCNSREVQSMEINPCNAGLGQGVMGYAKEQEQGVSKTKSLE